MEWKKKQCRESLNQELQLLTTQSIVSYEAKIVDLWI